MARSLYFQSGVPIHLWNECVLTAVFFINRIPSLMLHNQSPFTLLYNSPVDHSFFRTFGCLVYASTLNAHRLKFHPRARMCVFVGYQSGNKGYKLYDIESKQKKFPRDVFHEHIFPFIPFIKTLPSSILFQI